MARSVAIGWITPAEVSVGHWCDDCLLPSVVEVTMTMLTDGGVSTLGRVRLCRECEQQTTIRER